MSKRTRTTDSGSKKAGKSASKAAKKLIGSDAWVVIEKGGKERTVKVKASSVATMDKIVERYAGAMRRLAKR